MNSIVQIPEAIQIGNLILQIVTLTFGILITKKLGMQLLNGFVLAMSVAMLRRILDYAISFEAFSDVAYNVRYIELAYFPFIFSVFMILGFLQARTLYKLHKLEMGGFGNEN